MKKKIFFFVILPILLTAVLIVLYLRHTNALHLQKGALQITSSPESKVYLNDNYIGTTPLSKTEPQDMIQAGNYTLRLVPTDADFYEYQEKITITKGVLTVVDRKFRKGGLSEGYAISLNPLLDKKETELEVISFPPEADIALDANTIGKTPLLYKKPTESDHLLKINKIGYKEKAIRIRTTKGYRLIIIAYLGIVSDIAEPSPTISPSPPPTATPSATPAATKVLILNTPTGFLRVRSSYSLNSAIITTVSPGETFPLIGEQEDWFEIKLPDGKTGWINNQYAKQQ